MTELKLRVSGVYRPGEHVYPSGPQPLVQLVGSWLEEAGFPVGARVRVEVVEDGRLVLSRVGEWEVEKEAARAGAWERASSSADPEALVEVAHG